MERIRERIFDLLSEVDDVGDEMETRPKRHKPSIKSTERISLDRLTDDIQSLHAVRGLFVGQEVKVLCADNRFRSGWIRFLGNTSFQPGTWVGLQLQVPAGKNDGSIQGYVSCDLANVIIYKIMI